MGTREVDGAKNKGVAEGLIFLLLGILGLAAGLIIYYFEIGGSAGGWSFGNHDYWWLYLIAWVLASLIIEVGIFIMVVAMHKTPLIKSVPQHAPIYGRPIGESPRVVAPAWESVPEPVPVAPAAQAPIPESHPVNLRCRKCGSIFELDESKGEDELYCPGCGRVGNVNY